MGKQTSMLTFTGKVGRLRGSSWKSIPVMAQQPTSYTDRKSPVQEANRRKFKAINDLGRKLLPTLKIGFKSQAVKKTESNVFIQQNIGAVSDNGTVASVAMADLIVSLGNVPAFQGLANAASANAGETAFTWVDNSDGVVALATDIVCTCDVCNQDGSVTNTVTNKTRADGSLTIVHDAAHSGDTFSTYLYFKRAGAADTSDSNYISAIAN